MEGLMNFFPRLASNSHPPDLHLLSSNNYMLETLSQTKLLFVNAAGVPDTHCTQVLPRTEPPFTYRTLLSTICNGENTCAVSFATLLLVFLYNLTGPLIYHTEHESLQ
jgi:hypothetical protein